MKCSIILVAAFCLLVTTTAYAQIPGPICNIKPVHAPEAAGRIADFDMVPAEGYYIIRNYQQFLDYWFTLEKSHYEPVPYNEEFFNGGTGKQGYSLFVMFGFETSVSGSAGPQNYRATRICRNKGHNLIVQVHFDNYVGLKCPLGGYTYGVSLALRFPKSVGGQTFADFIEHEIICGS